MTLVDRAAAQLQEVRRVFLHHVDGMTDEEFLWEPVAGCWSVRNRDGDWVLEVVKPDPEPAPLTTIAWLITHMTLFLYAAERKLRGEAVSSPPPTFGTAADAIAEWTARADAVAAALAETSDEVFASDAGDLVWRTIYEETYHGAEVTRMRQLYANRATLRPGS